MTFRTPQRMELTGGCNLRDLGGHDTADGREVRRGVIYRSGVLSYLTPSDHNCIARAKISTIIELRHSDEIKSEERRVGKGWVSTCRSRWSPDHKKQKTKKTQQHTHAKKKS